MTTPDLIGPVASGRDADLAKVAQVCLMAALDHACVPRLPWSIKTAPGQKGWRWSCRQ